MNSVDISNELTQIVNFPTWILDCDYHSPALLDFFFSSDASICSKMAFPPVGNSDHVVVSVSIDVPINSKLACLMAILVLIGIVFMVIWKMYHARISLNSVLLLLLVNLVSGFRLEYISHHKYKVKPHSPPWFSAVCAAAIVHKYNFFRLYQQNKSCESKVRFWQASNHSKRVLEAVKLACATKIKESIISQKLGSWDFWWIANSVVNKGKSAIPPLFNGPEVLTSASDKAKLFAKNFSLNSNLDDSGVSLPVFPSRTNLKLHNISVTPKMVKKVIMNLDSSKASGPDCIQVVVLKNCEPELSYN